MYPVLSGQKMSSPDREIYQFYGKRLLWKENSAQQCVERALEATPMWALSCSFGKDSIVLLHFLLVRAKLELSVIYSDRGPEAEFPETELVIQQMKEKVPFDLIRVKPKYTMFELYHQIGGIPGISAKGDHAPIRENNLEEPIDGWLKEHNINGNFMGRRIEENKRTRGMHLRVRGPLHFNKKRILWTCDPLYNWTGKDIWGYIIKYDLPYHPVYDLAAKQEGHNREEMRISNWSGVVGIRYGRWAWLKHNYPDLFNRFAAEFPEVRGYV